MVVCKTCFNVQKFAGSTFNLVRHKWYITANRNPVDEEEVNVDMGTKQEGVKLVTEWAVKNCRSFKMPEDSGLKIFAKFKIFFNFF